MAAHLITQIRDAVVIALGSMATVPAARVFVDRVYALEDSELPCLTVMTAEDAAQYVTYGDGVGRGQQRTLMLDIDVNVSAKSDYDTTANQIQLEVEKAMAADTKLGGLVTDVQYAGRNKAATGDGKTPLLVLQLSYRIGYRVSEKTPDVAG